MVQNLAPLRSAIGMMEQWNPGIRPTAGREYWNGGFRESKRIFYKNIKKAL
jgi:hypothetical protein